MSLWGACKCCEQLKSEVAFLRLLVRPPEPKHDRLPTVTLEADAILSGADQQMTLTAEEHERQTLIDDEAARILSGQY